MSILSSGPELLSMRASIAYLSRRPATAQAPFKQMFILENASNENGRLPQQKVNARFATPQRTTVPL
jgi:hypothetical protein